MSRRGFGLGFCVIAAFLYAVNYIAAVMWLPQVTAYATDKGRLGTAYDEVGHGLTILAVVALCVGVVYVVWGEAPEHETTDAAKQP